MVPSLSPSLQILRIRISLTLFSQALTCVCVQSLSCIHLFATLWDAARQVSLSMGFFRQESWSGLPFPPPGDLPDPGTEPCLLHRQVGSLPLAPCHVGSPRYVLKGNEVCFPPTPTFFPSASWDVLLVKAIPGQVSERWQSNKTEGVWAPDFHREALC